MATVPVQVTGVVTRRREHGKKLLFFDLHVESDLTLHSLTSVGILASERERVQNIIPVLDGEERQTFQCVHSLKVYPKDSSMTLERFKGLTKLVMPRAVVKVRGIFAKTKTNETSLFAQELVVVRVQPDPSAIARILCHTARSAETTTTTQGDGDRTKGEGSRELGKEGETEEEEKSSSSLFDAKYCIRALGAGHHLASSQDVSTSGGRAGDSPASDFVHELQMLMDQHPSQFRKECTSIARQLQGLPCNHSRLKPRRISPEELSLLEGTRSRKLQEKYEVNLQDRDASLEQAGGGVFGLLERMIENIPTRDAEEKRRREKYLREKKFPQILWMMEQVDGIIKTIAGKRCNGAKEERGEKHVKDPIRIIDIGAGRGDLALALALHFKDAEFVVIDVNESSLEQGKALARKLKIHNIQFKLQDVKCINLFERDFDLFIGLHACGGLTDAILEQALAQRSPGSFLVCTCCFGKNKNLRPERFDAAFNSNVAADYENSICKLADCCTYDISYKAMHTLSMFPSFSPSLPLLIMLTSFFLLLSFHLLF